MPRFPAVLGLINHRLDRHEPPPLGEAVFYCAPGRAHHRVVVDMDLEKFFDRVNHDILMGKLSKKIGDKRVLKLIRRYLERG